MDQRERVGQYEDAMRAAIGGALSGVWTALPGIITSFDPARQTCSVQPAIQGQVRTPAGTTRSVDLPLLVDVPVCFPSGGGAVFTFPVTAGDEALVIFASRHIDAWWQSGGVQAPMSARQHSLSDGFAIVGPRSVPNVPAAISTSAAQLRSIDGTTSVSLNPAGGIVSVVAPGGLNIDAPLVRVTGDVVAGGGAGVSLTTHRHTGVQVGGGTSGTPV